MGRLRVMLPTARTLTQCSQVVPVNGVGRTVCGWLFSTASGPSGFTDTRHENGHWEGLVARLNDDPLAKTRTSPPPYVKTAHSECWRRVQPLSNGVPSGYMQVECSWGDIDSIPRFGFYSANGQAICDYDGYSASLGNSAVFFRTTGLASQGQQISDVGFCKSAVEVRPSDKYVRGWSDARPGIAGSDARVTGVGITTATGPFVPYLSAYNGQNGFGGAAAYGGVTITKERAVNLNVPAARSVRISVDGVVQTFAGAVPYINLPAGVGVFDPAAGVWWPSSVRYEFFNAANLGGALIADLTVAKSWGGDTIGMVP